MTAHNKRGLIQDRIDEVNLATAEREPLDTGHWQIGDPVS